MGITYLSELFNGDPTYTYTVRSPYSGAFRCRITRGSSVLADVQASTWGGAALGALEMAKQSAEAAQLRRAS